MGSDLRTLRTFSCLLPTIDRDLRPGVSLSIILGEKPKFLLDSPPRLQDCVLLRRLHLDFVDDELKGQSSLDPFQLRS